MSDTFRITGMVSGMDTDTMVKNLMKLEQSKVDKAKQNQQLLEWQKETYREVSSMLKGLQDSYFDVLSPSTNLRSASMFNVFSAEALINGSSTSKLSVSASSTASSGTKTITEISQLAQKDAWKSSAKVAGNVQGTSMTTAGGIGNINTLIGTDGELTFKLDGESKTITLDGGYADYSELVNDINTKLGDAFPSVSITASLTGAGTDQLEFAVGEDGHKFEIGSTNSDLLAATGLTAGDSNAVNTSQTLADAFGISGDQTFEINGTAFTFSDTTTVYNMMQEINNSAAGVTMSYSEMTDTFKLEADEEGAVNSISITNDSGFIGTTLKMVDDPTQEGLDARFTIDGVTTSRSSNEFTIDGVTITLKDTLAVTDDPIKINVDTNVDSAVDAIKGFVEKYNETIEYINNLTSEKRYYDYDPLTDEQKEAMSDSQIEDWEDMAKSGLLRSDSTLERITQSMRTALYESVEGVNITLHDIGISTSSSYTDRGKLVIDEDKLKSALEDNTSDVIKLFTNESDTKYTEYSSRATRYSENGIANRINDILKDSIRTTRDDNGYKGTLIEKAGVENDVTDTNNDISDRIKEYEDRIDDLLAAMYEKEEYYYAMFASMESSLSEMNTQSSWLTSQFG